MEICKTECLFIIKCPIGIVNRGDAEGAQPAGCAFFMVRLCGLPRRCAGSAVLFRAQASLTQICKPLIPKLHIRGLRGRTAKKGETLVSLLVNPPLSFRARCARKGKQHFAPAAQLLGQGKQNGCHPRTDAHCIPLRIRHNPITFVTRPANSLPKQLSRRFTLPPG